MVLNELKHSFEMCINQRGHSIHWLQNPASFEFYSIQLGPALSLFKTGDCSSSLGLHHPPKHPKLFIPHVGVTLLKQSLKFEELQSEGGVGDRQPRVCSSRTLLQEIKLCIIYHPSKPGSFATTLGVWPSGIPWVAGLLLLPPFNETLPPTFPIFQPVVRKFKKSHFIMRGNSVFAGLSPQPSQLCLSPICHKQVSYRSILPGKKK